MSCSDLHDWSFTTKYSCTPHNSWIIRKKDKENTSANWLAVHFLVLSFKGSSETPKIKSTSYFINQDIPFNFIFHLLRLPQHLENKAPDSVSFFLQMCSSLQRRQLGCAQDPSYVLQQHRTPLQSRSTWRWQRFNSSLGGSQANRLEFDTPILGTTKGDIVACKNTESKLNKAT